MAIEPETWIVAAPALFGNFVECRTRGQRRRLWIGRAKSLVKQIIGWKGAGKK